MAPPGTLLLIHRLRSMVAGALVQALKPFDLLSELGATLFPVHLWHQSLSSIHPQHCLEDLVEACATIDVPGFILELDRLRSRREDDRIRWELTCSKKGLEGFQRLLEARRVAFAAHSICDNIRNSAHLSVSYRAKKLVQPKDFAPVPWLVDSIELVQVQRSGHDYRYETVGRWPLKPVESAPPTQPQLFP